MTQARKIMDHMETGANATEQTKFCAEAVGQTMAKLRDEGLWRAAAPVLVGYRVEELEVDIECKVPNRAGRLITRRAPLRVSFGKVEDRGQAERINSAFASVIRGEITVDPVEAFDGGVFPFQLVGYRKADETLFSMALDENPAYLRLQLGSPQGKALIGVSKH